jgi:hypothetical protein
MPIAPPAPSPSPTPIASATVAPADTYADGIPRDIAGEHVYRPRDVASVASGDTPFLVGGWTEVSPIACPSASFVDVPGPEATAEQLLEGCPESTLGETLDDQGLWWRLKNPNHLPLPAQGAVVVRLHTHDPHAVDCPSDQRADCDAAYVIDALLWDRSGAQTPVPTSSGTAATGVDGALAALCHADPSTADAIVPLAHAFDYRAVVPALGFMPQLDVTDAAAVLVVYGGTSPIRPPDVPVFPPTILPGWTPAPAPTLRPGTTDVCIAVQGMPAPIVSDDVAVTAIHPELATSDRLPPMVGDAQVIGRVRAPVYSVIWDAPRGLLWYVVPSQGSATVYALDPATRRLRHWSLPAGTVSARDPDNGFTQDVAIDASGGVWFEATGLVLFRLDPATGTFRSQKLALKVGNWQNGGSWVSAIVPFGTGVIVARDNVPSLTRYDTAMRVVGTIPLPSSYSGPQVVARAGSNLVIDGRSAFGLFDVHGHLLQVLPYARWSEWFDGGPTRAYTDDLRRAAIWEVDHLLLLDAGGRRSGTVPVALDLPSGPFADLGGYSSEARADSLTTDWHGRWWYTIGSYVVEVDH